MQLQPYSSPWINNYQKQAEDAFNAATSMTSDQLRALRPPLPQIEYLPPRFGYPSYDERQWTVMQVFGLARNPSGSIPGLPRMRGKDRVDYSQNQGGYQGSDRNTSADQLGMGAGGMA